jgi:RHS repeat-associated protein
LEFYIDDVILEQSGRVKSYQTKEGYAVPLPTGTSVNYFYNIKDWLGTNRVVLDATGTRVNVTDHYAYGLKMPARNYSADVEGNRYQFTGHQFDGETNYEYHGARYYNRELGRYISVDPLAHQAFGWSPYRYCFDNPIKFIDPDGRFETRKEARAYRKKHDISGRIHKDSDGDGFSIDDKKNHQSYTKGDQSDIDNKFTDAEGIIKSDLVTANRKQQYNKSSISNDINDGLGLALGIKSELMTYAVAQNYKTATNNYAYSKLTASQQAWRATNTLGKTGSNLLKATKFLGAAGGALSVVTTSMTIANKGVENMTVRDGADMTVAVAGTAAAIFMASNPIGWGIGLGCLIYSAGTMIYDASTEK